MSSTEYSLPDVLDRMHENQHALEAAIMELTLLVESQGAIEIGGNVRGALDTIRENTGHIKQGLARLKAQGSRTGLIKEAVSRYAQQNMSPTSAGFFLP